MVAGDLIGIKCRIWSVCISHEKLKESWWDLGVNCIWEGRLSGFFVENWWPFILEYKLFLVSPMQKTLHWVKVMRYMRLLEELGSVGLYEIGEIDNWASLHVCGWFCSGVSVRLGARDRSKGRLRLVLTEIWQRLGCGRMWLRENGVADCRWKDRTKN